MARYAFRLRIKADAIEEYEREHQRVWPELLAKLQESCDLVDAEGCLKDAFSTDVRPAIREWARAKGLAEDPMDAFRQSGYLARITAARTQKNMAAVSSYA